MSYVTMDDLAGLGQQPAQRPECKTGFEGSVCNDVNPGFTKMFPRQLKNLMGIGAPRCIACGAQGVQLVKGSGRSVGLFCSKCAAGGWVKPAA